MFEKNLKFAYLLDFYGALLDEHTESVMKAYYDDDLSLAEVAEGIGISRQGVRHIIKRGEEQLEFYEARLGLAKRHSTVLDATEKLTELRSTLSDVAPDILPRIDEIVEMISPKG